MNNLISTWDGVKKRVRRPSSGISKSFVTTEFPTTRVNKILSYNLGQIDFKANPIDLNSTRNETIDRFKNEQKNSGDYKYASISNVFIDQEQVEKGSSGEYLIISHGVPVKNTTKENCAVHGLYCLQGNGTNKRCNSGKCVIGSITKRSEFSWSYSSVNLYGENSQPLTYSLFGTKQISLLNLLRGEYEGVKINSPASRYVDIYLPPINYITKFSFDTEILRDDKVFTQEQITIYIQDYYKAAKSNHIGINDPKPLFIAKVLAGAYPTKSEGELNGILKSNVTSQVEEYIVSNLDELPNAWLQESVRILDEQKSLSINTLDFLSKVYDQFNFSYQNILIGAKSSIRKSKITPGADELSRPIYNRLPGLSESYYKHPESEEEPIAKWLTSGADEFLTKTKDNIASFYYDYLDPDTCNPIHLDWLAQHMGLYGELWNIEWEKEIKISIIKNMYGWWDKNSEEYVPGIGDIKTTKGEALSKFPFLSSIWTDNELEDNSRFISLSEPETIRVNESDPTTIVEYFKYKEKTYNSTTGLFSLTPTNSLKFYKENWNGLIESKGTFIAIAFLSSIFGLKSHVPDELKIIKADVKTELLPNGSTKKYISNKVISPKSGLRASESSAPPLFPYKAEMIQIGDSIDAEIKNYPNQLVAGVSRAASYEASRNLFFRLPYYYNRNGRSWGKVEYIIKNWVPANINSRVQYAYLSADLWAVGDAFFEPEIEIKET